MQQEEKNNAGLILDLVSAVLGSWWTVIAGVMLGSAAAIVSLHYLPKSYEASTTIFVAPPKVPESLVRTTVTDDMGVRMAALEQAVLSRPYMQRLLERTLGLPEDDQAQERMINGVRNSIAVRVSQYRISHNENAGLFTLSFRHENPQMAADVVNTLAELYIAENAQVRSARASQTTDTMRNLAESSEADLIDIEKRIADFEKRHRFELASHQEANLRLLETKQAALDTNETMLEIARDRLSLLESQLGQYEQTTATSGEGAATAVSSHAARLAQLQKELDDLLLKYHESHPDVERKKREIAEHRQRGQGPAGASARESLMGDPAYATLLSQKRSQEMEIERLQAESLRIRQDIAIYNRRIEATPGVEQQLAELKKGYEAKKKAYESHLANVETAQDAEVIEERQQGKQFEVVEKAFAPSIPVSPVPLLVYGACLVAGVGLFVGPLLGYTLLHPVITGEERLKELARVPVLVTIPRIATPQIRQRVKRRTLRNWLLSAASTAILSAVVLVLG